MLKKAVFLDRDNCIIHDVPYSADPNKILFFDDTFSALKEIQDLGFLLFIVTNQSGIGRGAFSEKDLHLFHESLLKKLIIKDIHIQEIVYCPHTSADKCLCRKPEPKLTLDLMAKYKIDPKSSFFIGDKVSDAKNGENAGITGCIVRNQNSDYQCFANLKEFASFLKQK